MLIPGLCLLLLCVFGSILSLPLLALLTAGMVFFERGSVPNSEAALVVFVCILLSVPAAAYIAGALLDVFSVRVENGRLFAPLALVLSSFLLLHSDAWYEALLAVVGTGESTYLQYLHALAAVFSNVLLAAGLTAFILMLLPLIFEIPIHWVLDDKRINIRNELQALRPIWLLVIFALGFRLFVGLFVHHLNLAQVL